MKFKNISLLLIILSTIACSDSNGDADKDTSEPTDLILTVDVSEDGNGDVSVQAKAINAIEYYFDMGEDGQSPVIQASGTYMHNYATSGSYNITVRAYGQSGRYILQEKRIRVISGVIVDVGKGYSTPLNYDNMELVWNDEFNGNVLNSSDWSYEEGDGCPDLCGWGNNELEYYREENIWVADGICTIEARKENFQDREYTSGKILTRSKQTFQYGRIDIRAKLPKGQGIWPALWMLGQDHANFGWPKSGEIDIMEMVGGQNRENTSHGNAFWDDNGKKDFLGDYILPAGIFNDEFHVFSLIWDLNQLRWFVDDNAFHSMEITSLEKTEFHKPFYCILNVAVGGNWPGSPDGTTDFPTQMHVDYVRVFQAK